MSKIKGKRYAIAIYKGAGLKQNRLVYKGGRHYLNEFEDSNKIAEFSASEAEKMIHRLQHGKKKIVAVLDLSPYGSNPHKANKKEIAKEEIKAIIAREFNKGNIHEMSDINPKIFHQVLYEAGVKNYEHVAEAIKDELVYMEENEQLPSDIYSLNMDHFDSEFKSKYAHGGTTPTAWKRFLEWCNEKI